MTTLNKRVVALVINLTIVLMEIYALILTFSESGVRIFKYYTDNSNILTFISCIAFSAYLILTFKKPNLKCPKIIKYLKYFSCSSLGLTFFVVLFILAPLSGGLGTQFMLFYGSMLYHHFLCPLILVISFIFFEDDITLSFKDSFISLIPTAIYAGVIIFLNVLKTIVGPYKFFHVYEQSFVVTIIWFITIFSLAYILGYSLYKLKTIKKGKRLFSYHN